MQKSSLSYGIRKHPGTFFATASVATAHLPQMMERVLKDAIQNLTFPVSTLSLVQLLKSREAELGGALWTRVEWKTSEQLWCEWTFKEGFRWVTCTNLRSLIQMTSGHQLGVDVNLNCYFQADEKSISSDFLNTNEWEKWQNQTIPQILRHKTLDQWLGIQSVGELSSALLQTLRQQFPDLMQVSVQDQHRTFQSSC